MDLNKFEIVINEVENILRGIRSKIDEISREEWIHMELGSREYKSDEEAIAWNQIIQINNWKNDESYYGVELLFENVDIARKRLSSALEYISNTKMNASERELVYYSSIALMLFAMRDLDGPDIDEIVIIIEQNIRALDIAEAENKYLHKIFEILDQKMYYAFNIIEGIKDCEKLSNEYYESMNRLLREAKEINPQGMIVEIFSEISYIEKVIKNPTKENINDLRKCFMRKDNWMNHIFTCDSLRMSDIDSPVHHYIPHVRFITSSDSTTSIIDRICWTKPKGYWVGKEDEYEEKVKKWKKESYDKIFALPYEICTKESQGELFYKFLYLLTENMELESTKNEIVSDFTHRYKNYEIDNIYNIANALNRNPSKEELENYGRELMLEYYNKQMMTREVSMLSLEHKDDFEELKIVLKNSITDSKNRVDIEDLINEALKRVLIRILLVVDEKRVDDIRNKYEERGIDTYELLERYENDILRGDKKCVDWINVYMNNLSIKISDEWKELFFVKNSEGSVFIMSLLMELFINQFTYSDITADCEMQFDTEKNDNCLYFTISTKNKVNYSIRSNGRKGLDSRNRILNKLNYGKDYKWHNSIIKEYLYENTVCSVTANIKASLFGK